MKNTLIFTMLFAAALCSAQPALTTDITYTIPVVKPIPPQAHELELTIEDVQDVIARDNENLRALIRLWYVRALKSGNTDSEAVEIALDKLGRLLLETAKEDSK